MDQALSMLKIASEWVIGLISKYPFNIAFIILIILVAITIIGYMIKGHEDDD